MVLCAVCGVRSVLRARASAPRAFARGDAKGGERRRGGTEGSGPRV